MKVDSLTLGPELAQVPKMASDAEAKGYGGWLVGETTGDVFAALALAAEHTSEIQLGTAITVAFPRSPMHVAYSANDIQRMCEGRLILGLGSQIRPHIEKRFSTEWSKPAARMREYVLALRAIWATWNEGDKLEFEGEFYRHTLMTPFFSPAPNPFGPPKVGIAAVGPKMTEVAGEVADVLLCHGFTTRRFFEEVTLPAVRRGAERAGRSIDDIEISIPVFTITGGNDDEKASSEALAKSQLGFYGSTPAYWPVLELHGWGDLGRELNRLSKSGGWDEMSDLINDEVLAAFAVVAEPDEVATGIVDRIGDYAARTTLYVAYDYDGDGWSNFVNTLANA